jgi:hypothetical protein
LIIARCQWRGIAAHSEGGTGISRALTVHVSHQLLITDCIFEHNQGYGAVEGDRSFSPDLIACGMIPQLSDPIIVSSIILIRVVMRDNQRVGGMIELQYCSATIDQLWATNNNDMLHGGILKLHYYSSEDAAIISNSYIHDNSVQYYGGVVWMYSAYEPLIIRNTTITNNTAGTIGSVFATGGAYSVASPSRYPLIDDATIIRDNHATYMGDNAELVTEAARLIPIAPATLVIIDHTSTQYLRPSLVFHVRDWFGHNMTYQDGGTMARINASGSIIATGTVEAPMRIVDNKRQQVGVITFDELSLTAAPGTKATFDVLLYSYTLTTPPVQVLHHALTITISFRHCLPGEETDDDRCKYCATV